MTWNDDHSAAYATWTCSACGETETADAIIGIQTTDATCAEPGIKQIFATAMLGNTICRDSYTQTIDVLDHVYTAPDFQWNTVDFTCISYTECTECGDSFYEDCTVVKGTLPPDYETTGGAIYTAYITIGGIEYSDIYIVPGDPIVHDYGTPTVVWSDDFQTAEVVAVCSSCPDDHPAKTLTAPCTVKTQTIPATCSAAGYTTYTARGDLLDAVWEDKQTVTHAMLEHNYTAPVFTWNKNTCRASYECTVGGETFDLVCTVTEVTEYETCTSDGICTRTAEITVGSKTYRSSDESTVAPKGHTLERVVGKAPSCTEEGLSDGLKCTVCDEVEPNQTPIPALGHTEILIKGTAATCTQSGMTDGVYCQVCRETLTAQEEIPALGHIEKTITGTAPTCTQSGTTDQIICSVCEEILTASQEIPARGHTEVVISGIAATCTKSGSTDGVFCSVCEEILTAQTVLPPLGHTEKTVAGTEPTCTKAGYTEKVICSVCEVTLTASKVLAARGHTETVIAGTAPTCTEKGWSDGTFCSVCEEILTAQKELPAAGHTPIKQNGQPVSCTEPGSTDGLVCAVCSSILQAQDVIDAAGHFPITKEGCEPTCTEDGYTESSICSVCRITLTEAVTLPSSGHTPMETEGLAPTCTEDGYSAGSICTVCQTTLKEATPIPARGHTFGDAVFVWSDDCETVTAAKSCLADCAETMTADNIVLARKDSTDGDRKVVMFTATATFADGTTASDQKTMTLTQEPDPTPSPTEPEQPANPSQPSQPETPETPAKPTESAPVFDDVPRNSYYSDAVLWAAKRNITQGTAARQFSPDMICSRAQIVTMLWRASGSPVSDAAVTFSDVAPNAYYYHAVMWAAACGITSGTSETTFSPDLQCSRAQIVTMLWRAAGCPGSVTTLSFTDVPSGAWYAGAVKWAVSCGITLGTGVQTFSPDAQCTRAQIVTFLYRAQTLLDMFS